MAEQVTGNDSWLESVGGFLGEYFKKGADLALDVVRAEKLPIDNASANPVTAPSLTTGVQPTGQPVLLSPQGIAENWPMIIAAIVVLVALIALVWKVVA